MFQGGVTDIATSKLVARKLYMQYSSGSQMERQAMEKMLVDTYKIMVCYGVVRINSMYPPRRMSICILIFWIRMGMEGLVFKIFNPLLLSIWLDPKKSNTYLNIDPIPKTLEKDWQSPKDFFRSLIATKVVF